MQPAPQGPPKKKKRLSLYDDNGVVDLHAETVWDASKNVSQWAVYQKSIGKITYAQQIRWPLDGETYFPQDGGNSGFLEKKAILLPSEASGYGSESALLDEVQGFMRTYMVMPEEYYLLCAHYVLLTWLGDCFPALPYLRARGDVGVGKSRYLQTIGSLCYCPIFASGATTASPVFRIYELYHRATFLFDEADWDTRNDENGEIIKILNFGYQKGAAVLRSVHDGDNVEPRAYDVFGPKLLATRNVFADSALESRCFTLGLRAEKDLDNTPENVGLNFWRQATEIRNKLLMWRFHHFKIHDEIPNLDLPAIHPRLRMLMTPMIMTREHEESRQDLIAYLATLNQDIQERRSMDLEAAILGALLECVSDQAGLYAGPDCNVAVQDIANKMNETREAEGEEKISTRKIHAVLKTRINITVKRIGRKYVVVEDLDYIQRVASTFGLDDTPVAAIEVPATVPEIQSPAQGEFLEEPPDNE